MKPPDFLNSVILKSSYRVDLIKELEQVQKTTNMVLSHKNFHTVKY